MKGIIEPLHKVENQGLELPCISIRVVLSSPPRVEVGQFNAVNFATSGSEPRQEWGYTASYRGLLEG